MLTKKKKLEYAIIS